MRRGLLFKLLKGAVWLAFFAVLALSASAQMGGIGWTAKPVTFKIQSPTNAPQSARYFVTNNPLASYHCLVYSNDGAFSIGNTTLPRTEQRFEPDYTGGEIQYQATLMAPSNENSYCVFQIHTGDAQSPTNGSTTFMLFWFSSDGGSVHDYSGTELAKNLGNQWFQLNVDHNLVTRTIKVWINQKLVWTQQDNGAGDFYFKDGVYEQSHGPTLQMDTYITNILMWTSSGTNTGFQLFASPSSQSMITGNRTNYTVTLATSNDFSGSVVLGVGGLPAGATASFTPPTLSAAGTSTLTIQTATNAPGGSYPLMIEGTNGSAVYTTPVTLKLTSLSVPSFNGGRALAGGNVVFSGSGGQPNGAYYVLSSTSLTRPFGQWNSIATNVFDGSGNFSLTNPLDANQRQVFYRLLVP